MTYLDKPPGASVQHMPPIAGLGETEGPSLFWPILGVLVALWWFGREEERANPKARARIRRGSRWVKQTRPFAGEVVVVTSIHRGAVHFDSGAGRAYRDIADFLRVYAPEMP